MQVKSGHDRIVILIPLLGVAVKFPMIRLLRFFVNQHQDIRRGTLCESWSWPVEVYGGPKNLLFKGIADNWREWRFWRKTRHEFLQPTLFSLFGLVNVQKLGKPCDLSDRDHWAQLYDISNGKSFCDPHHLSNPANFCFNNRSVRILDYGSLRVHDFVSEFGAAIIEQYDTGFCRQERKGVVVSALSREWTMGLESDPFERVKSGRKLVEFRLDKPKWKEMAIGDTITFGQEPDRTETIIVRVANLMRHPTFHELLNQCQQAGLLEEGRSVEEQAQRLEKRYPENERSRYPGVLGIRMEIIRK